MGSRIAAQFANARIPSLLLDIVIPGAKNRDQAARNGVEAVDLARKHRPDLILMDIQLPEVSGLEVTQWLKDDEELRSIPVVAVTAFAMKGDEERIREGGCEAYLSKPISVGRFIETIRHFLGNP